MALHPTPNQRSGEDPSTLPKKVNLASLMADIENGTAEVLPHHFVESIATPEIPSTSPDPMPITSQEQPFNGGRDRSILRQRAVNNSSPPRQKFKARHQDDKENSSKENDFGPAPRKSVKAAQHQGQDNTVKYRAANTLNTPSKNVKAVKLQDQCDKENDCPAQDLHSRNDIDEYPAKSKNVRPQIHRYRSSFDDTKSLSPEASDTTTPKRKQHKQAKKELKDRTQSQNQEYVPRRFFDMATHRWWVDCEYCRGEGGERASRLWQEHDREGANKRVDAHNKNIKIKCIHCRFYFDNYGMIGCRPE
ncbi:hypothetical protein EG328_006068 [Venturia inaequalis]|uniref:Uncharacterized protein n=1 Tax=Venturia inaequalis TaxID=5025 RepID=A0A8H3UKD8_VENIN|nr:hypothetical protein EG328_006068 [Venturia inaequalis]